MRKLWPNQNLENHVGIFSTIVYPNDPEADEQNLQVKNKFIVCAEFVF